MIKATRQYGDKYRSAKYGTSTWVSVKHPEYSADRCTEQRKDGFKWDLFWTLLLDVPNIEKQLHNWLLTNEIVCDPVNIKTKKNIGASKKNYDALNVCTFSNIK